MDIDTLQVARLISDWCTPESPTSRASTWLREIAKVAADPDRSWTGEEAGRLADAVPTKTAIHIVAELELFLISDEVKVTSAGISELTRCLLETAAYLIIDKSGVDRTEMIELARRFHRDTV